jgi:hypothetical protein
MSAERLAIVAGSGPDLWSELQDAQRCAPGAELIAVNLTGLFLPRVRHLVSLHPELLGPLRALRLSCDWVDAASEREQRPPVTHSREQRTPGGAQLVWDGVDHHWPLSPQGRGGTSALFAVWVALEHLGYDRVILAGVPLDGSRRFFDPPHTAPWRGAADPRGLGALSMDRGPWEEAARTWFSGRVRSCSSWTGALLGRPDVLQEAIA